MICYFHKEVQEIAQKIKKRFWNIDKKILILPIDSLQFFKDEILKLDNMDIIESIENIPVFVRHREIHQFEVKCPFNEKILKILVLIKDKYCHRELKIWYLPTSKFDYVFDNIASISGVEIEYFGLFLFHYIYFLI